ncbi:39S ribosomal protein L48, mitochondrial-like [Paramacrobiotus metropolitanus]|uniref:39S ribosomal protein L48, mitochondrial-like n=1 Tax=Paramacrobiotus metropolitanus TaxID=2943436 RepID=UPI00244564BC|nr:39S ribosomal protein L48, mitochondrial-like [Paramacrobiotus metropolitanus]
MTTFGKICGFCGRYSVPILLKSKGTPEQRFLRIPFVNQRYISTSQCAKGIYEPEDLPPPSAPAHDLLNIRMRGYDFAVIENHMSYVTKLASSLGADFIKKWATPAESKRVTTFKPQSTLVEHEYDMVMYERNVQIGGVTISMLGLLLDTLNTTLPEGVTLTIKQHEPIDEEVRYIPDYELNALKAQLDELGGPVRTKK